MATKKITELPFINTLSGSSVFDNPTQNTVVPVVLKGTTNQITVENFSKFINLYTATTGSAGNIFVGPQTINNSLTINGNEIVNGNVNITGRLTVNEVVAQYETASILFSTGSTKLGDEITDKHEFTGSTNITGSLIVNGANLTDFSASNSTLFTNFSSSNSSYNTTFSSSNATTFTNFSSSNSTYNTTFSSSNATYVTALSSSNSTVFTNYSSSNSTTFTNYSSSTANTINGLSSGVSSELARVYQTTQSLHVATASLQFHSASVDAQLLAIQQTTQSLQVATASLQAFTASQDSRNFTISQITSSFAGEIGGLEEYSASLKAAAIVSSSTQIQNYDLFAINSVMYIATGSIKGEIAGIEAYTASLKGQAIVSSSTQVQNYDLFALNSNLYTSTGSLIGITNGLMAFTAALDSTYATDAQLYQLYQATRSIELTTGSLIGITNELMAFTAALDSTYATDAQLFQLYQATRSIELTTGSLIGITNGLMAFTAALDSTYATDAQLYQLYQATQSLELHSGSMVGVTNGLMAFSSSQLAVNLTLSTVTGSLIGITNGLMAFTAALDNTYATDAQLYQLYQATQSLELHSGSMIGITNALMAFTAALDSTYATDAQLYQLYAETASIKAEIAGIEAYTASLKGAAIVSSSQQITNYYKFAETASANTFYGNQTINDGLTVNGRLGLQVSNPDANTKLHIADTTNGFVGLRLSGSGDYTGTDWTIYASSLTAPSADDFLGFYNNSTTDGATSDYKVRMFKNGDVQVVNGNIVIGTSGKGIDFSATSNSSGTTSSELLNDYEEGTFTPTYTGTNLTVVSYGNQFGWYTKVGRLVTVTICLMTEDITVIGSENVKIGGLPFTSNSTSQAVNALVIGDSSRWATNPPKYGVLNNNSTEILLYRDSGATGAGTDPVTVKTDDMADATGNRNMIRATLTYFV